MLKIFHLCIFLVAFLLAPVVHCKEVSLKKIAHDAGLPMLTQTSFGKTGMIFNFKPGSYTFSFNGIILPLGTRINFHNNGDYCLDHDTFQKCIFPLLYKSNHAKKIKIVALDAGHGGTDNGTYSKFNNITEKALSLDLCFRIARMLRTKGYNVVFTRPNDKKVALSKRTTIANAANADLFISIHFNAASNHQANGIETFILTPPHMHSNFHTSVPSSTLEGNKYDQLNLLLGYLLQKSCTAAVSCSDRGVKYNRFVVLKELHCPGALIECGFLSNRAESNKIATEEHREKLAQAITNAIISFDHIQSRN